ncbi:MAG: hemerythrin domain-containing protein [Verrucomicrobiae bacterium]|jgi:hemerythrin-like domain-containing protein|nr:hemerythrin domain-containing protein [Verrucomicrobiae bacterium]
MKITDALQAEHFVFHNLFDYIERNVPSSQNLVEIKALARLLESVHEAHSRVEDELIIEPLMHCLDNIAQAENFEAEHKEIDESLNGVDKAKTIEEARLLLLRTVHWCRKHFDREERIIFPLAEQWLKDRNLTDLGEAWKKQRRENHD